MRTRGDSWPLAQRDLAPAAPKKSPPRNVARRQNPKRIINHQEHYEHDESIEQEEAEAAEKSTIIHQFSDPSDTSCVKNRLSCCFVFFVSLWLPFRAR